MHVQQFSMKENGNFDFIQWRWLWALATKVDYQRDIFVQARTILKNSGRLQFQREINNISSLHSSALNSANWCYEPSRSYGECTKVTVIKNDFACTLNWKLGEEAALSIKRSTVATTIIRSIINTVQTHWTPHGGPSRLLHSKTTRITVTVDPQLLTKSLSIMSAVFSLCGVLMGGGKCVFEFVPSK